MLVCAGTIYGAAGTPAFGFEHLDVNGAVLTSTDAIREQVGVATGTNLVTLATQPVIDRLRSIPAVADAAVAVRLPDVLRVEVTERQPVLLWGVGDHRYAVDASGLLFSEVGEDAPAAVSALPVVIDDRISSAGLGVRSQLDRTDIDAASRLGSLTPDQIGSHADHLAVTVTDERGFTISSGPRGWVAVFGFYGESQRSPTLIPGQVQLLTALLKGREDTVETVILADDRDGTYIPKPTPKPSSSSKP
jgi:POTRA domain, FtsQ-type